MPVTRSPSSYAHLFGPVLSRRMGWSLGIDLVPHKTCSFDCPFCQVGRTTGKTITRREYVPVKAVLSELEDWMSRGGQADYITLAGSGEPTLHSRFGDVLRAARGAGRYRTALLSNGTLLSRAAVRRDAGCADIVKASLSAWDENSFQRVNRPHPSLCFRQVLRGLVDFRGTFDGEFWIEVFLLRGINDAPAQVRRIAAHVASVTPDRIQLNTVVRPPAEPSALAVPDEQLHELARLFAPRASVIAVTGGTCEPKARLLSVRDREAAILAVVHRHPAGVADIARGLGLVGTEVELILNSLCRKRKVTRALCGGVVCYHAAALNRGGD